MLNIRFESQLVALLLLLAGCADNAPNESVQSPVTSTSAGSMTGSSSGGTGGQNTQESSGSQASGTSSGNATGSMTDEDASMPTPPPACQDSDKKTRGNTCPGVVTCGDAVEACSLTTQNCCVSDYKADAASCNEGKTCKGIVSAACDGPEDCSNGQVCCISVSLTASAPFAAIQHRCVADASKCTGGVLVNRLLCHTDAQCAAGEGCEPIGNLPWWGICK